MKYLVPLGRLLFSVIFVMAAPNHFTKGAIAYAAGHGVPMAFIAVPVSGVLALLGGLSILLGYRAKCGAWFLVLFLVPVTLMMHNFWAIMDPVAAMIQKTNFMKNISMLGAALLITHFGSGPLSMDSKKT